jgi:Fe-S-cluster-containing hydrogenase component 2
MLATDLVTQAAGEVLRLDPDMLAAARRMDGEKPHVHVMKYLQVKGIPYAGHHRHGNGCQHACPVP